MADGKKQPLFYRKKTIFGKKTAPRAEIAKARGAER